MEEKGIRKATIRTVAELKPIEKADRLEIAVIDGWQCVVGKGQFKPGDACVYFEIDSLIPEIPQFEFLKPRQTFKPYPVDGEPEGKMFTKLKTAKFRGALSQGLAMPVADFVEKLLGIPSVGIDVSEALGVYAYEKPVPANLRGLIKGLRPSFVPKTDEERIQNCAGIIPLLQGVKCYSSLKVDGTSATYYYKKDTDTYGICSRNLEIKYDPSNTYCAMGDKYNLEKDLKEIAEEFGFDLVVIQGEIAGPEIQQNPLGLKEVEFFMFNASCDGAYQSYDFLKTISQKHRIPMVPTLDIDFSFDFQSVAELLTYADQNYPTNNDIAEGVVIRPMQEEAYNEYMKGRLSFKVINNRYLLEGKEE